MTSATEPTPEDGPLTPEDGPPTPTPVVQRVSVEDELLDGPLDDPLVLAGNLRDLQRTNRWLGGTRLSLRAVELLVGAVDAPSILDVGTGAADIPWSMLEEARRRGRAWCVTAVDSRTEVVAAAHAVRPELSTMPGLRIEVADGRALPYDDDSFDVSHASLVIHHLEPTDAIAFLRELARVARIGVVVNDLVRSRLTTVGAWLAAHLFTTNPYTRHDGPLSARRAYARVELIALLTAAGLEVTADIPGPARHRWAFAALKR